MSRWSVATDMNGKRGRFPCADCRTLPSQTLFLSKKQSDPSFLPVLTYSDPPAAPVLLRPSHRRRAACPTLRCFAFPSPPTPRGESRLRASSGVSPTRNCSATPCSPKSGRPTVGRSTTSGEFSLELQVNLFCHIISPSHWHLRPRLPTFPPFSFVAPGSCLMKCSKALTSFNSSQRFCSKNTNYIHFHKQ
jgi:hypothetical protein